MRILLVEDERDLHEVLLKVLKKEGYVVDSAYDGEEALDFAKAYAYDIILLDRMLPKVSGDRVLSALKAGRNPAKILLITARGSIEERVKGLDEGADDYLVKPFSLEELLARIRVCIRQTAGETGSRLQTLDVKLDLSKKEVVRKGQKIPLTAKEFEIFAFLMKNMDRTLSREQILAHVWDNEYDTSSNHIDVLIKNIRKKLQLTPLDGPIIHTKRGMGYVVYRESGD